MFLFIFLILVIAGVAGFIIYNNKKLVLLKQQLMISNNQINNLKTKLSGVCPSGKVQLKFLTPQNKGGIIKENSKVLISPIENSMTLHKPNVKMEVYIIDMVQNRSTIWYYVILPLENSINSHGWVKATDFSILYSYSQSVYRK